MKVEQVPISALHHWPGNARRHNLPALCESLNTYGQTKPLVVQRSTKQVLAGNGTMDAAVELGWDKLAVHYVDVDEQTATKLVLLDNRTADLASYDEAALVAQLQSVTDLGGSGFTLDDLDDLASQLGTLPEVTATTFDGGFVANEDRGEPRPPLAKAGLKEVILVLRAEELRAFEQRVAELAEGFNTETVTATVLEALRRVGT
jgi:hypothetical protein